MPEQPIDWAALTPRERDAVVAQHVFGYTLNYEFADVLGAPSVPALRDRWDDWGLLPYYSTAYDSMHQVENEIDRRGLGSQYAGALAGLLGDTADLWTILRATPAQRCQAALIALGVLRHDT